MTFKKIFTTFFIFVFSFSSAFSVNENTSLASEEPNKIESQNSQDVIVPKRDDDKDSQKFKLNNSSTWTTSENLWIQDWSQNTSNPSQSTNSWNINNSLTWSENSSSWTWSQNSNSWTTNSWSIGSSFEQNFQIKNTFQNPTYLLEKDQEKEEYFCEKDDCKVNFDFRQSFSESFKQKDFTCEFYASGSLVEENCNPKTIEIVEKETILKIKILKKSDKNIFKEKEFKIFKNNQNSWTGSSNTGSTNSWTTNSWTISTWSTNSWTTNSWSQNNSLTWATNSWNTNSWSINSPSTNTWITISDFAKSFQIKNIFQNPTYLLEKDQEKDEYFCDSFNDCKVNFDFRSSFSEDFKQKDFICEFLSSGSLIEENCNPKTVEIKEFENIFEIKVSKKTDKSIFKKREIKIIKRQNISSTWTTNSWSVNSGSTNSWNLNSDFEQNFQIKNIFQKPTYLIEKEKDKSEYLCESSICKVNFDFRSSFSEDFKQKDFICEFFSSGSLIEENCNPKTVDIIEKETIFKVKILKKSDKNIFKEREFKILKNNSWISAQTQDFVKPRIVVQSGLNDKKCLTKDCKVNFTFSTKNKNLRCEWTFWNGDFKPWTEKKCNSSAVSFPYWKHLVVLKVFDKKNWSLYGEDLLEFENTFEPKNLEAEIILTWKSKKYQLWSWFALCLDEKCNFNFSAYNSSKDIKKYLWDFWNGKTFEWKNPSIQTFEPWNHKISLKVFDEKNNSKEYFYNIEVRKNILKEIFEKKQEKNLFPLKIRKNQNFLIISWNSRKNILVKKYSTSALTWYFPDEIFEIIPDQNWDFKKELPHKRAWNFIFEFYQIWENWEEIFSEKRKIEITYKDYFISNFNKLEPKIQKVKKARTIKKNSVKNQKQQEKKFLEIYLQWKPTKNKITNWKKVKCIWICSLNFWLKTNIKQKNIYWKLWNWETFEWKNPKSKKFLPWKYKIEVEFIDENGEKLLDFFEVEVVKKVRKKRARKSKKIKTWPVNLIIEVQWRASKNKILSENKLTCYKTCNVNFDWRKSSWAYKSLNWDFWNGETFTWENPKSVKYLKPWKYKVLLKTEDYKGKTYEKIFEVEFIEKPINAYSKQISNKNVLEEELKEKDLEKQDFFFIFTIISLIWSWSFILLRKYNII